MSVSVMSNFSPSLSQMVDFIHSFHDLVDRGHQEVGKVNLELEESVVSLPVEKMLEQFVLQKYTGLVSSQEGLKST